MKNPVRNNPLKMEQMRTALVEKPRTYDELAEISGLSKIAVARWVHQHRTESVGLIHISGYAKDVRGRLFVPQFSWGAGSDAQRPGYQRTAADRMRDMRARRTAAS